MNAIHSILIIVTSFSEIAPGETTGLWLEEFAVPYMEFKSKGYNVNVASIQGDKAPVDPRSKPSAEQHEAWAEAIQALDKTVPIASIKAMNYDAVFIPGGHGTMFDFPNSEELHKVLRDFANRIK
jgi:putative intracellular protease/amidase